MQNTAIAVATEAMAQTSFFSCKTEWSDAFSPVFDSATSSDFNNGLSLTNDTVTQNNAIKKRFYFGPVDISRLQLQILDEFGRILDLNNMDYSMALNLVCLYD